VAEVFTDNYSDVKNVDEIKKASVDSVASGVQWETKILTLRIPI
jgi:hypothetical protein